jgi:hypothetical protein
VVVLPNGGEPERPPEGPPPEPPAPPPPPVPSLPAGFGETVASGALSPSVQFREFKQDGALLVGFDIGARASGDGISYLRPIYRSSNGESFGPAYGKPGGVIVTVKAKDGYAVGGIRVEGGGHMNSLCLTFMRVLKEGLDPSDWMVSDWYGAGDGKPGQRNGDGALVVGIHGARFALNENNGPIGKLGLVTVPARPTAGMGEAPAGAPLIELGAEVPLPPGWKKSDALGMEYARVGTKKFNEFRTDGSLLIGFEVGLGQGKEFWKDKTIVTYTRSIWLTPAGREDFGVPFGKRPENVITLKAKEGYAVSGLEATGGPAMEGFALYFAKRLPRKGLSNNSKDIYVSQWVGGARPAQGLKSVHAGSLGTVPVVGVHGERFEKPFDPRIEAAGAVIQFGIVVPNKLDAWPITQPPLENAPAGKPQPTAGPGSFQGESFAEAAPEGGWLIGVEAGVVKWQEYDLVAGARPVFATGDRVTDGPFRGTTTERTFRAVAKPGYAVGAIVVRAGARVNGFSVVFMKVKGGKLDPNDSYESAWIGGADGGGPKTKIGGTGDPVVGLTGCVNEAKHLGGIGLLVLPPAGK